MQPIHVSLSLSLPSSLKAIKTRLEKHTWKTHFMLCPVPSSLLRRPPESFGSPSSAFTDWADVLSSVHLSTSLRSPRAHRAPPPSAPSSLPAQFVLSEVKGQHSQVLSFPRPHFTQSAPHLAGVSEPAPRPRFSIRRGVPADVLSGRLSLGE